MRFIDVRSFGRIFRSAISSALYPIVFVARSQEGFDAGGPVFLAVDRGIEAPPQAPRYNADFDQSAAAECILQCTARDAAEHRSGLVRGRNRLDMLQLHPAPPLALTTHNPTLQYRPDTRPLLPSPHFS